MKTGANLLAVRRDDHHVDAHVEVPAKMLQPEESSDGTSLASRREFQNMVMHLNHHALLGIFLPKEDNVWVNDVEELGADCRDSTEEVRANSTLVSPRPDIAGYVCIVTIGIHELLGR